MDKRIYLIGFMGSGKSHTGRQLAGKLGYAFVDLDDRIEAEAGMDIPAIFRRDGEDEFRRIEQKVLHATQNLQATVISTGGGTPCFFDNMDWMNRHGLTIFLDASAEVLARRLMPERAHRPLLQPYNRDTLIDFIRSKLAERMYFYQKAQIHFLQPESSGDVATALLKQMDGK